MKNKVAPVCAAIDIGSNTIHLVVARCRPDDLEILDDQVEMVRIGESVTANGEISAQKLRHSLKTLREYKALAERYEAERIFVVATEAIRKASNSADFLEQVQRKTGLHVEIISGTTEATLTFYGATYEESKTQGASAPLGVMDLGGGSTELVTAKQMHIVWRISMPIGSGWLHDRYLPSNPPTADELAIAQTFLQTYLQGMRLKNAPTRLIVTGGSANSLLYLAQLAHHLDKGSQRLTYDELVRCEGLLCALSAEEIAKRYGQPTSRARVLPAGALIIREVMKRLKLSEIVVSPHGIREGALLAFARYGEQWLQKVGEESDNAQSGTTLLVKDEAVEDGVVAEAFVQAGKRMLGERGEKLFEWRAEVLKNEDIEAVHKMRVATRRLRATLDAFESCCKPRQFKKVYRRIQEMADNLGAARDTDVMLQGLHDTAEQVTTEEKAGVQWLMKRLETYRAQRQEALEAFFETLDEDKLRREIEACIQKGAASNGKSKTG